MLIQVFGSAISAKRDFPSIIYDCFWEVHRVIHVHVYMYTSRVQVSLASVRSCGDNISIGEDWPPALA